MSDIEDRLNALDARLSARASELEQRISSRFGGASGTPRSGTPGSSRETGLSRKSSAPFRAPGTRYGLFVGVNESPGNIVLHGCVNDANDLRDACVELGGWNRGDTIVLENGSGGAFLDGLAKFASAAKAGDTVLISFSGHGGAFGNRPDDDFVFAMSDGPLPEKEFRKALSGFNLGVRVVVVVDACHSDAAAVAGQIGQYSLSNVGWITASTSWQSSQDSFQGSRKNGFLTGAILDGWRNGGAAGMAEHVKGPVSGGSNPGTVSFLDLAVFVAHSWRYWHPGEQQPQYHNPAVLSAVVAGNAGAAAAVSRDGKTDSANRADYHLYCDKCGYEWYSSHWDDHCPKFGCTGHVHKM